MPEEADYGLSAADARTFRKLVHAERTRPQNLRGMPGADFFQDDAGSLYIAQVPAAGIRGRIGRKVYSDVCNVWQIVQETAGTGTGTDRGPPPGTGTHAYPQFVLGLAPAESRAVYNIAEGDLVGGSFVSIGVDAFGTWHVLGAGASVDAGRTLLRTMPGFLGIQEPVGTGCPTGTGTGFGGGECGLIYYASEVYEPDLKCQDYAPTGQFVWSADILGRRLEPDRFYWGDFAGIPGVTLKGILTPADQIDVFTPDETSPLYLIDIGTPSRTIKPDSKIGKLCVTETGTGTGTGGPSGTTIGHGKKDLIVYSARTYLRERTVCAYDVIESCLVANAEGCELDISRFVTGTFHRMVPRRVYPGMAPDKCLPLYITTDRKAPKAVADVRCEGGILKVYFLGSDGCQTSVDFGHDAGCCDCGGSSPGTGTSSGCWCTGKPTSTTFTAGTFTGLTNGTCLSCAFSFPSTMTMSSAGQPACAWSASTISDPCGGSMSATLTVASDGSADFVIGGGAHNVSAHYHLASGFNCNGSNSFSLVSNGSGCSNWPTTITIAP